MSDKIEINCDEVICPNCVHQFRAIPVNVQKELSEKDKQIEGLTVCRNHWKKSYVELKKQIRELVIESKHQPKQT